MEAISTNSDQPLASTRNEELTEFTDWHTTCSNEPSEAEKKKAREKTLEIGNKTSVGQYSDDERTAKYDRLDKHNRDNYWGYRNDVSISQSTDIQFKRNALLAFAHQLSLTPLQRQVALNQLLSLDLPRCGHRTEVIVFCVCAGVVNDDAESYFCTEKPYYPTRKPDNNHSAFATLQAQLIERWERITESRILSVYQKVRQQSLPTLDTDSSRQPDFNGTEVQQYPSYSPDWAIPQES